MTPATGIDHNLDNSVISQMTVEQQLVDEANALALGIKWKHDIGCRHDRTKEVDDCTDDFRRMCLALAAIGPAEAEAVGWHRGSQTS